MVNWSRWEREAFTHAALSGRFRPLAALPDELKTDLLRAAETASALAGLCDTESGTDGTWVMRTRSRRWVLERLDREGRLAAAIKARQQTADAEAADLLAALTGAPPYDEPGRRALLAAADAAVGNGDAASLTDARAALARLAAAIDRAGPAGAAFAELVKVQTRLSQLEKAERRAEMGGTRLIGRDAELAAILDWLGGAGPGTVAVAHVAGLPGAGKSVLLEHVAMARAAPAAGDLVVRLDFDRAGLDVLDLHRLTMEAARQVGDSLGDGGIELLQARLAAAAVSPADTRLLATEIRQLPAALVQAMATAMAASAARGGPRGLLFVLDTVEVLRARGSAHPEQLLDWLEALALATPEGAAGPALRIAAIMAERGPLPADAARRLAERPGLLRVALGPLPDVAAIALLRDAGCPPGGDALALQLAAGSPLILRLAATALAADPALAATALAADPALAADRTAAAVARAVIYRYLTSRLDDPRLKQLAPPALLLRALDAGLLAHEVAPAAGLGPLAAADATHLLALLEVQQWLMEPVPDRPGWLRPRPEPAAVLQRLLPLADPGLVQALAPPEAAPAAAPAAAPPDDPSEELLGLTEMALPMAAPAGPPAEGVAERLVALLDREDWVEGELVAQAWAVSGQPDLAGPDAAAVTAFRWRAGLWADAFELMRRRLEVDPGGQSLLDQPLSVRAAFLEMWAAVQPDLLAPALALDPFRHAAATPRQDPAQLARHGALGFRLRLGDGPAPPANGLPDPVGAALALAGVQPDEGAAAFAFRVARQRLAARGGEVKRLGWNDRQLLASLSPYPLFAARLMVQPGTRAIADHAARTHAALVAAGGLFVPPLRGLQAGSGQPLAGIADLGLFAEWAGAAAWRTGNANLGAIAGVAERWRQTVAGRWSIGPPPDGWKAMAPDLTLSARLRAIGGDVGAARRQLALFAGDVPAERLEAMLAAEFGGHAGSGEAASRAMALAAAGLPSAFVPAMALILSPPADGKERP